MKYKIIPKKLGKKLIKMLKDSKSKKSKKIDDIKIEKKDNRQSLFDKLMKDYKKYKPSIKSEKFQSPNANTFIIYDENSNEIYRHRGTIPKKKLNKIASRYSDATVMVDLGRGLYKRISISVFKKLTQIKYIQFERDYEFLTPDGYEPDGFNWYVPPVVIDHIYSINQLLKVLLLEDAFDKANDVYLSAKFYLLSGIDKKCKILFKNKQTRKLKYKKFLKEFELEEKEKLLEKRK